MKIPEKPPDEQEYVRRVVNQHQHQSSPFDLFPWLNRGLKPVDRKNRYLHWDDLKHKPAPEGLTPQEHWFGVKAARHAGKEELPLRAKSGEAFWYCIPNTVTNELLYVSEQTKGAVDADPVVTDKATQRTYLISSLIEESISSSQLEGASTTRRVAKEMIRQGREPKDLSEQMILNNYRAMNFVRRHVDDPLTPTIIFELHALLMDGTLSEADAEKSGRFREDADDIVVGDRVTGETLHVPPKVAELPERLKKLCAFANGECGDPQMPPLIRAVFVHFMIGYDHPFFDGNGRLARAVFAWMVAKAGFWLLEYVAISSVLKSEPEAYMRSYLHTETDNNDATYFIVYQLSVLRRAIERLHEYLGRKTAQDRETKKLLSEAGVSNRFNYRQIAILQHAIERPGAEFTVKSHQTSHGVSNQTARTDLTYLAEDLRLLTLARNGREVVFIAPRDITQRIMELPRSTKRTLRSRAAAK